TLCCLPAKQSIQGFKRIPLRSGNTSLLERTCSPFSLMCLNHLCHNSTRFGLQPVQSVTFLSISYNK
ncbi:unnamed protein product, partial [Musa textilis]